MKNKFITFISSIIAFILLFPLVACDSVNLDDYKANSKITIQNYADGRQNSYGKNNWQIVVNIVEECKGAIDASENKTGIDSSVDNAKRSIDRVVKLMAGAEEYPAGDGTENNPYIIGNRGQLIHFSNQINDNENTNAHFALCSDIDLEGMEWTPVGVGGRFNGVFDGRGHEISNFNIKESNIDCAGLFGYVGGNVLNLGVIGFEISVTGYHLRVGGLIGYLNGGSVANCYAIGNISGAAERRKVSVASPSIVEIGGLVGFNQEGIIINCYAECDVSAIKYEDISRIYVSSLVVGNYAANCYAAGDVKVSGNPVDSDYKNELFSIQNNCYIYEGQRIFVGIEIQENIMERPSSLLTCVSDELNSPAFYTDKLGWSIDVWDLENIYFSEGKYIGGQYPKLKKT